MPIISIPQFLAVTDRISALYDLFLTTEERANTPPSSAFYQQGTAYPARLLVDLTGQGVYVLLRFLVTGDDGNAYSFTIVDPGIPNAPLQSISFGTELSVSLMTDSNGNTISVAEDVVSLMKTSADFSNFEIIYPISGIGGFVVPFSRTQFMGGVNTGSLSLPTFTLITLLSGPFGNDYTITIVNPATPNALLSIDLNGPDLVISLGTNSGGYPTTTVGQLITALESIIASSTAFKASALSNFLILTTRPTALVLPQTQKNFIGAGNGSAANIVLTHPINSFILSADYDVAKLATPARSMDEGVTAFNIDRNLAYLDNLQLALANHFIALSYPGGMQGYLDDHGILVHENFSTIQASRTGVSLRAASVFRPDIVLLAQITISGSSLVFTAGTPLGAGTGNQTSTNFGPQELIATVVPHGGTLAANLSFTLVLMSSDGSIVTSHLVSFTAGQTTGTQVSITAQVTVQKFYSVNSAVLVSPGTNGDKVIITQVPERQISL